VSLFLFFEGVIHDHQEIEHFSASLSFLHSGSISCR
jgi:hypothetical protein